MVKSCSVQFAAGPLIVKCGAMTLIVKCGANIGQYSRVRTLCSTFYSWGPGM